ncbi:hypothetical protein RRF57_010526 [Xylaria bambusicola]|uniref:EamA domain-containing protein n=1 Tax=Xylaria bambusicola TaxID=326684 RepID=A0AAN7USH4_9PEZI
MVMGVSKDSSSAATLMIYSQIVWALVMDRVFFYLSPNLWALLGVITIIGSLCLVTVAEERKGGIVNEHLDIENEGVELLDIDEGDF